MIKTNEHPYMWSLKPRLVEGMQDRWTWQPCSSGVYSTKSAYLWLMKDLMHGDRGTLELDLETQNSFQYPVLCLAAMSLCATN